MKDVDKYLDEINTLSRDTLVSLANRFLRDDQLCKLFKHQVMSKQQTSPYSARQSIIKKWLSELNIQANNPSATLLNKLICSGLNLDPFGFSDLYVTTGYNAASGIRSVEELYTYKDQQTKESKALKENQEDLRVRFDSPTGRVRRGENAITEAGEDLLKYGTGIASIVDADIDKYVAIFNKGNEMNVNDKVRPTLLVGNHDVSTMTDEEVFSLIKRREERIDELTAVRSKPKKLEKLIGEIQEEINALVKFVDEREVKE